jgi:hypothetical protein
MNNRVINFIKKIYNNTVNEIHRYKKFAFSYTGCIVAIIEAILLLLLFLGIFVLHDNELKKELPSPSIMERDVYKTEYNGD